MIQKRITISLPFLGNANLVYTIIRKRNVFHTMANLPTDHSAIAKALTKRGKRGMQQPASSVAAAAGGEQGKGEVSMEGSFPAMEAEPGTLKVTLAATPGEWWAVGVGVWGLGVVRVESSVRYVLG